MKNLTFKLALASLTFASISAFACVDLSGNYDVQFMGQTAPGNIATELGKANTASYTMSGAGGRGSFIADGASHLLQDQISYTANCTDKGFKANINDGGGDVTMTFEQINADGDILISVSDSANKESAQTMLMKKKNTLGAAK